MSASAFSLSAAIPAEGFAVTAGEPVIGGLHGATRHFFCPHCMSWMFTRPEGMDWFVNLRADDARRPGWFAPLIETWTEREAALGGDDGGAQLSDGSADGGLRRAHCRVCGAGTEARRAMILCVAGEGRLATRGWTPVTHDWETGRPIDGLGDTCCHAASRGR